MGTKELLGRGHAFRAKKGGAGLEGSKPRKKPEPREEEEEFYPSWGPDSDIYHLLKSYGLVFKKIEEMESEQTKESA